MAQEQLDGGSGRGGNVVNIVLMYGHPQIFFKRKKENEHTKGYGSGKTGTH